MKKSLTPETIERNRKHREWAVLNHKLARLTGEIARVNFPGNAANVSFELMKKLLEKEV